MGMFGCPCGEQTNEEDTATVSQGVKTVIGNVAVVLSDSQYFTLSSMFQRTYVRAAASICVLAQFLFLILKIHHSDKLDGWNYHYVLSPAYALMFVAIGASFFDLGKYSGGHSKTVHLMFIFMWMLVGGGLGLYAHGLEDNNYSYQFAGAVAALSSVALVAFINLLMAFDTCFDCLSGWSKATPRTAESVNLTGRRAVRLPNSVALTQLDGSIPAPV